MANLQVGAAVSDALTPAERAEHFALSFRNNANHLAVQFGGPVYLVGSVLTSLSPGDVDLRCLIEREDAWALFGKDCDDVHAEWGPGRLARGREELKQSRRLTRRWRGYPARRFDFQFQIVIWDDARTAPILDDRPRIRLDRIPNDFFQVGRNDP